MKATTHRAKNSYHTALIFKTQFNLLSSLEKRAFQNPLVTTGKIGIWIQSSVMIRTILLSKTWIYTKKL